jgi:hypothetical protein
MSKLPRRHHYTPQFYLRAFTGSDGLLWQYRREPSGALAERKVSPKSTGFERDLYTIRDVAPYFPERDPTGIESSLLAPIDDAAAVVLRKLNAEQEPNLSEEERAAWATFLNSMIERDPLVLREREALAPEFAKQVIERMRGRARSAGSLARLDDTLDSLDCRAMSLNSVREQMVRGIRDEATVTALGNRGWVLLRVDDGTDLITSDAPLVINAGTNARPIEILTMALSPSRMFVLYPSWWSRDDHEFQEFLRLAVACHNLTLVDGPGRFLYARRRVEDAENVRLRTAVEQYFGRRGVRGS